MSTSLSLVASGSHKSDGAELDLQFPPSTLAVGLDDRKN